MKKNRVLAVIIAFVMFLAVLAVVPSRAYADEDTQVTITETEAETETTTVEDTTTVASEDTENSVSDEVADILGNFFDAQTVTTILTWAAYIVTMIGLAVKVVNISKSRSSTIDDVKQAILDEFDTTIGKQMISEVKNYIAQNENAQSNVTAVLSSFAKILALSQENTAESRVAILNMIEQLGVVNKQITDSAKASVKAEQIEEKSTQEKAEAVIQSVSNYDGTKI